LIKVGKDDNRIEGLLINDQLVTDSKLMVDKFNEFFTYVGQSLADKIPPSNKTYEYYMGHSPCSSFGILPTSPNEILKIGQTMRITHSAGCDDLDPFILSGHLDQLALLLTEIFNSSFATGNVPQFFKMAKITPIFK